MTLVRLRDDITPGKQPNARLYMPTLGSPRKVHFVPRQRTVSYQGGPCSCDELEQVCPYYVLEITDGYSGAGLNAGFTGARLFESDEHPTKGPGEALLSMYPTAWWLTLLIAAWLERRGFRPWELLVPADAPYTVHLAVGLGLVDRRVVTRIQQYTFRRKALADH